MKPIAVAVFVLALGAGTAEAQVVKYVDSSGVVHYVGSETQIPEQYRATMRLLKQATQQQDQVTQQQNQGMERAEAADGAVDDQAPEEADTADKLNGVEEQ